MSANSDIRGKINQYIASIEPGRTLGVSDFCFANGGLERDAVLGDWSYAIRIARENRVVQRLNRNHHKKIA
jgi:hypothetical protein